MTDFSEKMRILMDARAMSLRMLAEIVHFDAGYLSKVRNGIRTPSADLARKIDDALEADGQLAALAQAALGNTGRASTVAVTKSNPGNSDGEDDEMQRRRLLQALAALGIASTPAIEALQYIRTGVDGATGRNERSHLDEWEEVVAEYGYSCLLLPPQQLLGELAADLVAVQQVASHHCGDRLSPSWSRITAGLAAVTAKTLCSLQQPRIARQWWETAQHAADASRDAELSMWISGERLVHGLYDDRPGPVLLRRTDELIQRASGTSCSGHVKAHAVRAQLLALNGATAEASAELDACARVFDTLPGSVTGDVRSVMGWAENRLRYTEAWVHAHAGDRDRLDRAVEQALGILPYDTPRTRTQLKLMRASGYVRAGDVTEGVRYAHTIYAAQPVEHRTSMVVSLAHQVAEAVPRTDRNGSAVADYRELLASKSIA